MPGKPQQFSRLKLLSILLALSSIPYSTAMANGLYQFVVPVQVSNIPETVSRWRVKCVAGNYIHVPTRDLGENPPTSRVGGPSRDDPAWEPLSAQVLVSGQKEFEVPATRDINQEVTVDAGYKGGSIDEGYELRQYRCAVQMKFGSNFGDWCIPSEDSSRSACRLDPTAPSHIQTIGAVPERFPGF